MHLLLAELTAKPDCVATVEKILYGLVELAMAETGNVHYAVHRQTEKPDAFVVYELYRDEAACHEHLALPHVKQALQRFTELLSEPPRVLNCTLLAVSEPRGTSS